MESCRFLFQKYLEVSGNRQSTKESKSRALKMFERAVGDLPVESIRYCHAEDFRGFLAERNPKTINLYVGHMLDFLYWLVKRDFIRINPWSELTCLPTEDRLTQPYKEAEIFRMLKVAFDLRSRIMILLGYCSGLRLSEGLNLVRDDFLFDKEMLQITNKKQTAATWKWDIKNRKSAFAPLPEYLILCNEKIFLHQMILELMDSLPAGQPYVLIRPVHYERSIKKDRPTKDDKYGNFDRLFKRICKLARCHRGRFQGLRVRFVNKFIESGATPKECQLAARHRSMNTTMRYYAQSEEKSVVAKLVKSFK